jgi:hypothetical protein
MNLVGEILRVEFTDHAAGPETIDFVAVGRCVFADDLQIVLDSWYYPDSMTYDDNVERFALVRSCVRSVGVLRPTKKK